MPTILSCTCRISRLRNTGLRQGSPPSRDAYFRAMPEVCVERARLVTQASTRPRPFRQIAHHVLDKAKLYRRVLEKRTRWCATVGRGGWHGAVCIAGSLACSPDRPPPDSRACRFIPNSWPWRCGPSWRRSARAPSNPYHITRRGSARAQRGGLSPLARWQHHELARKRGYVRKTRIRPTELDAPDEVARAMVFFLASKPNASRTPFRISRAR
jgi:hypothetical protein